MVFGFRPESRSPSTGFPNCQGCVAYDEEVFRVERFVNILAGGPDVPLEASP
jgi:hypothetical protein